MTRCVHHDLAVKPSRDELAAQDFVSALRGHVLNHMASELKQHYLRDIEPKLTGKAGAVIGGQAVHKAMKLDLYFKFYSGLRVNAQEMVWSSVRDTVVREQSSLNARARALSADTARAAGTLELVDNFKVPANVASIDVHLQPGGYQHDGGADDVSAAAIYENGLSVFSFGLMGQNLDDIGESISTWLKARHPDFAPRRILDLGCTVGHQTLPWKRRYPDAEVFGIDVSAPCLRYAHARAQSLGVEAHFKQRDARNIGFEDHSFDLVFSSMFLHELPVKDTKAMMKEARRLLKPGGLMLHYELPPNKDMSAFDGFYLDWDSYYNNEPWYKSFRDQDPTALCSEAGFPADGYFQTAVPSLGWYGEEAVLKAVTEQADVSSDRTSRLADGVQWFIFGNWA